MKTHLLKTLVIIDILPGLVNAGHAESSARLWLISPKNDIEMEERVNILSLTFQCQM